ncbi:MAG: hypothetical protein WCJ70_03240 [bacterium]
MTKSLLLVALLASLMGGIFLSRQKQTTPFFTRAEVPQFKYSCRPVDSINIDFIDPRPPPKKAEDPPVQNVTIKRGQKINVVIGISTVDTSQTTILPNFVAYKRLGSSPNFQYEKIGPLSEKLLASTAWPGVFSVSLTYDQIAEYLKNDSRDEARDYLQLNGQLDDPNADPMLRAGTTACVARITLADRATYVAPSPVSTEKISPRPTSVPTSVPPTVPPAANPPLSQNIIDTTSYWPQRGRSYLYKGYNYRGDRNSNPIEGRMQLDILPSNICGIDGDNYRFTKSNAFMYWTPCISGACDTASPNSEMVFAYEKYYTVSGNALEQVMTLPFDTVVQPIEGHGKFLSDSASSLSNLTYAAFTKKQYDNMEKNYPRSLKQPEDYQRISQQPYDVVYTHDPIRGTTVGYPFLPKLLNTANMQGADLAAENMLFMRTGNRSSLCSIKQNLSSTIIDPIPRRTDRQDVELFHTRYVNYAFYATKELVLYSPSGAELYRGKPLIVSMHEMLTDTGCSIHNFDKGACPHVLREDWYLAPGIGLVRLEQKFIDMYFSLPRNVRGKNMCSGDDDCYSRSEMMNPDYVMNLIASGDTPPPANNPAYDKPYNIFDTNAHPFVTPIPSISVSPPTKVKKIALHHLYKFQSDPLKGPSAPFMKTLVGIYQESDYHCIKLPSKRQCAVAFEDQCGVRNGGIPANYFAGSARPWFCVEDKVRGDMMQERCGRLPENDEQFITIEEEKRLYPNRILSPRRYPYQCSWQKVTEAGRSYDIFDLTITIPSTDMEDWKSYQYVWGNAIEPMSTNIPMFVGPVNFAPSSILGYPRGAIPETNTPDTDRLDINVVTVLQ